MRAFRWVMTGLVIICLLPFICSFGAQAVALAAGCELDLVTAHPCTVAGFDIGETLMLIGMQGYAAFFTVPALILLLPLWGIVEIIAWVRRSRAKAA